MKTTLLVLLFVSQVFGFWEREFNGSDGFAAFRIQPCGAVHVASNKYYIVGGLISQSVGASTPGVANVIIYDMDTKTFSNGPNYPSPTAAASCDFVGDNLFVYGGNTGAAKLDLTAVLDVSAATPAWQTVSTVIPGKRSFSTMNAVGTKIYLQGGGQSAAGIQYNDSYSLDTVTRTWTDVGYTNGPSARSGSASAVWRDKFYVFGGRANGRFFNDIYMLDNTTGFYTNLTTTGSFPTPKVAKAAISADGKFYLFSGGNRGLEIEYQEFHVLDLTTLVWTKINDNDTAADGVSFPGKRSYYLSWIHRNKFYVALGAYANGVPNGSNGAAYNDVWSLDLTNSSAWLPTSAPPTSSTVATTAETTQTTVGTTLTTDSTTASTNQTATTQTATGTTTAVTDISDTVQTDSTANTSNNPDESGAIQNFIAMGLVIVISMCL